MKMRTHIVAGILAASLLAGGCGKFVRDELITMQNEIDLLYGQVEQAKKGLDALQGIVRAMAANGYIVDVKEIEDEERGGYTLVFRTVELDDDGNVVSDDTITIDLLSGMDGRDGLDAEPFVLTVKQGEDGRWYWYSTQDEDFLHFEDGSLIPVDGQTPDVKIENGYWWKSLDGGETWEKLTPEKPFMFFTAANVLDDRVELTLAYDGSTLVIPRLQPVDVALTIGERPLEGDILIAEGEKIPIHYVLSGTGAENAVLVAGTDGRLKTALRVESDTEGTVEVTCPDVFPEGDDGYVGYVYIMVNDGNGRSDVQVIRFTRRIWRVLSGDLKYTAPAAGGTVRVSFESNFEMDATCVFPEGVDPWITAKLEVPEGVDIPVLTYDIAANTAAEPREGVIVVFPKDNPGFELLRITVTQAAAEVPTGSGN